MEQASLGELIAHVVVAVVDRLKERRVIRFTSSAAVFVLLGAAKLMVSVLMLSNTDVPMPQTFLIYWDIMLCRQLREGVV